MSLSHHDDAASDLNASSRLDRLARFEVIDDQMAAILGKKTDAQRLRSVDAFWKSARAIIKAAIRTENPEWDSQAVNREIARRISNGATETSDLYRFYV